MATRRRTLRAVKSGSERRPWSPRSATAPSGALFLLLSSTTSTRSCVGSVPLGFRLRRHIGSNAGSGPSGTTSPPSLGHQIH
eukprot:2533456-Prymnesium_polylepis.1